uniref:hypothetical protein n=1 Tax=Kocuria palustris TaxID=71999 RepID=UPI0016466030|nr:hypothetical protein [Kocuria palustris]
MPTRDAKRRRSKKTRSETTTPRPVNWEAAQKRAEAAMRRSKAAIDAGETFAAQKPPERRGAPSSYTPGRTG